ncbi:MAG: hypothetical protein ABIG71_01235 [Candidatus Uhrbacteria bacterium]
MKQRTESKPIEEMLERIERGEVHMRPRIRFVVEMIAVGVGIVIAFAAAVFLFSLATYFLRATGAFLGPGSRIVIGTFPWGILLATVILFMLLVAFLRSMRFAYRRPLTYVLLAVVVVIGIFSTLIAWTSFHPAMHVRAGVNRLPVVGGLYRQHDLDTFPGMRVGHILSLSNTSLQLETPDGAMDVVIDAETRIAGGGPLQVGDAVFAICEERDGVFRAVGIRPFDGLQRPFFPNRCAGGRCERWSERRL